MSRTIIAVHLVSFPSLPHSHLTLHMFLDKNTCCDSENRMKLVSNRRLARLISCPKCKSAPLFGWYLVLPRESRSRNDNLAINLSPPTHRRQQSLERHYCRECENFPSEDYPSKIARHEASSVHQNATRLKQLKQGVELE